MIVPLWSLPTLAVVVAVVWVWCAAVRSIAGFVGESSHELATWVLVVTLVPVVGPLLWWWIGRANEAAHRAGGHVR